MRLFSFMMFGRMVLSIGITGRSENSGALMVKRFFLRNQINYLDGTDSNSTSVECVSRTEPDGTQTCIPKHFFLTDEIIYNSDSETNNLTSTMAPLTTKKRMSRKEALQKTLDAVQPLGVIIGIIFSFNHVKS